MSDVGSTLAELHVSGAGGPSYIHTGNGYGVIQAQLRANYSALVPPTTQVAATMTSCV